MIRQQVTVNRSLLGLMSLACGGVALLLTLWDRHQADGMGGALLRIGILLGALWLFIPQRLTNRRVAVLPLWGAGVMLVLLVLLARIRVPVLYLVMALTVFLVLIWFVKPRPRHH